MLFFSHTHRVASALTDASARYRLQPVMRNGRSRQTGETWDGQHIGRGGNTPSNMWTLIIKSMKKSILIYFDFHLGLTHTYQILSNSQAKKNTVLLAINYEWRIQQHDFGNGLQVLQEKLRRLEESLGGVFRWPGRPLPGNMALELLKAAKKRWVKFGALWFVDSLYINYIYIYLYMHIYIYMYAASRVHLFFLQTMYHERSNLVIVNHIDFWTILYCKYQWNMHSGGFWWGVWAYIIIYIYIQYIYIYIIQCIYIYTVYIYIHSIYIYTFVWPWKGESCRPAWRKNAGYLSLAIVASRWADEWSHYKWQIKQWKQLII